MAILRLILLLSLYLLHPELEAKSNDIVRGLSQRIDKARNRIVSLAPSITETLYSLHLGGQIVGVTKYCKVSGDAKNLPKIGGLLDLNYEAIVLLKPTQVITLVEQEQVRVSLKRLGIEALSVNHQTIEGILASILELGRRFGQEDRARFVHADIISRKEKMKSDVGGWVNRPSVLFVVEHNPESKTVENLLVAGREGFYDRLIADAGGRNVITDSIVRYPRLSREALYRLDPDIVIDVQAKDKSIPTRFIEAQWAGLKNLKAVKNGNVHILDNDVYVHPGPGFIVIMETIHEILTKARKVVSGK